MAKRKHRRLVATAVQSGGMGVLLIVAPWFVTAPVLVPVVKALAPMGWILLAVAGVFWGLARATSGSAGRQRSVKPDAVVEPRNVRAYTPRFTASSAPNAAVPVAVAVATPRTLPPPRPTTWSRDVFEQIEWRRFEAVVEALFAQAGFETQSQSHGADGGVDVWLFAKGAPNAPVGIVQCKHWSSARVGVDKIRELRGVMAAHKLTRGQFATTSSFTDTAVSFARDNGVNLLDIDALLAIIERRNPERQAALLQVALDGDYWRPTCVKCGVKMIEKSARVGGNRFWSCASYPTCRGTMNMRSQTKLRGAVTDAG